MFEESTRSTLKIIRSRLQAVLDTKPLSNKLLTKALVFSYERPSEFDRTDLKDVR